MFKNALVSVSDKTGLSEFLKKFPGIRIVSTGGTAEHLKKDGFSVIDISQQTQFPEVMGGRVKTLHPKVHMALLSRPGVQEDDKLLSDQGLEPFDLLICNLYPFEETLKKKPPFDELIEKIDIGGPSMLRAAAKNFKRITVICDPQDYLWVGKQKLELKDRQKLAAKVFSHCGTYDNLIAQSIGEEFPDELGLPGRKNLALRYGENPQQQAVWYKSLGNDSGLHAATICQGKALSYNNLLDLEAATSLVRTFSDPTAVAIKHTNPCGVGAAHTIEQALEKALKADPVSVFGGIIALNKTLTVSCAEQLSSLFLECIIAPKIEKQALEIFAKKKNLRVMEWPQLLSAEKKHIVSTISGGFVIQTVDLLKQDTSSWKFIGEKPNGQIMNDLLFAEKVCAHLKSNAIAICGDGMSLGLGMGQVNRVEAVEHAFKRCKAHHSGFSGIRVLASDAFFPFADSMEIIAKEGIKWVLQPGGSVKDDEVIAAAQRLNVNMVLTEVRHFKH